MSDPLDQFAELDEVLKRVLEVDSERRQQVIDECCGKDKQRRNALEWLLRESAAGDCLLDSGEVLDGALWRDLIERADTDGQSAALLQQGREPDSDATMVMPAAQSFETGAIIGHYEILSGIGAGGMGKVFRARDTRLQRLVAIKVLDIGRRHDASDRERFLREAQVASALNHPNVVTIYDVAFLGDLSLIAMEYVEGESLAGILKRGAMTLDSALEFAVQIAEGLAAAHAAGIVHRDLKPQNVMVSRDGTAKIVDFGVAKLGQTDLIQPDAARREARLTQAGAIVGTIGYMSPEQARGVDADYRSDQFSLGVILYEMLTAQRPFGRDKLHEALAATINDHPTPIGLLEARIPQPLRWTIERCLSKSPEERYSETEILASELVGVRDSLAEASTRRDTEAVVKLPAERTTFLGRSRELLECEALLLGEGCRLVTLSGPGGCGKSRLALQVARRVAAGFPGGVFFVGLAEIANPDLLLTAVAGSLDISQSRGHPEDWLREELGKPHRPLTLLVIDNFEHLLTAAPAVGELLDSCPNLYVLATSREVLRLSGERELRVPPMAFPDADHVPAPKELEKWPAVALFAERAAGAKKGFELTTENAGSVVEICRRLDGLPLAIELAAARLRVLDPSALLERLEHRLEFLVGGRRDLPERQQTLRATIDWSYGLLEVPEKRLLRRLAVFRGGWTLEAVEAVADVGQDLAIDALVGMESLLDKNLVRQVEKATTHGGETVDAHTREPYFTMLETIREYGLEMLAGAGEAEATRKAHAAYYLVLAEGAERGQPSHGTWVERFDFEHGNLRAALDWLIESGPVDWGLRLAAALLSFFAIGEHIAEGLRVHERLLARGGHTPRPRARALCSYGALCFEGGAYAKGIPFLREANRIYEDLGDAQGLIATLGLLGNAHVMAGDMKNAIAASEEAIGRARSLDDERSLASALTSFASVFSNLGDFDRAGELHRESLDLSVSVGDAPAVAWSLNFLADVARHRRQLGEARRLFEASLDMFRSLGERRCCAECTRDLGHVTRMEGDHVRARELFRKSLMEFHSLGLKRSVARALEGLAFSAIEQRQPERGLMLAGAAAALRGDVSRGVRRFDAEELEGWLGKGREEAAGGAHAAWMAGWGLSLEGALEYALED